MLFLNFLNNVILRVQNALQVENSLQAVYKLSKLYAMLNFQKLIRSSDEHS